MATTFKRLWFIGNGLWTVVLFLLNWIGVLQTGKDVFNNRTGIMSTAIAILKWQWTPIILFLGGVLVLVLIHYDLLGKKRRVAPSTVGQKSNAVQKGIVIEGFEDSDVSNNRISNIQGPAIEIKRGKRITAHGNVIDGDRRKEIADRLGEFLSQGQHWKWFCEKPHGDIFPGDQIALWRNDVEYYVLSKLGPAFHARLTSDIRIERSVPSTVAKEFVGTWWHTHIRCVRLHEFIEELSK